MNPDLTRAIEITRSKNLCSTSLLVREMKISYDYAIALVHKMEAMGVVGEFTGNKTREVKK